MPEKFAFIQLLGDGSAIDFDHGASAPRTSIMNLPRDQFLAGTRLAGNQHTGVGRPHHLDLPQDGSQCRTAADNFTIGLGFQDFFMEVGVFQFQLTAQALDFLFRLFALADVSEDHHGSQQFHILSNGSADIFHRESGSILPPEHLIRNRMDFAIFKSRVNRTFQIRIGRSIGFRMVSQLVLTVSDHFFGRISGHSFRGGIHKRGPPFKVHTVHALARRLQNQLVQVAHTF